MSQKTDDQAELSLADLSPEERAFFLERLNDFVVDGATSTSIKSRSRTVSHIPLSYAQERVWFLNQLIPESASYNIPWVWRVLGTLDVGALESSINEVVRRHESLRTTFRAINGGPVQVVAENVKIPIRIVDLRGLTLADQHKAVRRLTKEEAEKTFDLETGPLLRVALLRLAAAQSVLLITVHHIVSDGWSMGVLFREIDEIYAAVREGRQASLSDLPVQYPDFALWQRDWLQGEVLDRQLVYWKDTLRGALPVLDLPADRPRPAVQTFRGASHYFHLGRQLTDSLKTLGRLSASTLFMTLLAAFETLLCRYTGQSDIIVGTPTANRGRREIEDLIGFFANTLALRVDLSGDPIFIELLNRVKEDCLAAYAHQDLPFEKLVELLQPRRDLSRNPLFQVMFMLQSAPMSPLKLYDMNVTAQQAEIGTAKFDLTLSLIETEEGLGGAFEYSTDLFEQARIERMARHLKTLLEGIVADPGRRISEFPMLSDMEKHRVLPKWNDTLAQNSGERIQRLFEKQVERVPEAMAVADQEGAITYRELNERANRLAHYLVNLGVGPEVLVGIYVERSMEMIVGLLGILKAGGAYVPLDPNYPRYRLELMLDDARPSILITQERLLETIPRGCTHIVCVDRDRALIEGQPTHNLASRASDQTLAYVIYTSGSTGRPKGVAITHCALKHVLQAMLVAVGVNGTDVFVSLTTLGFDIAALELFAPLIAGARLQLMSGEASHDGRLLSRVIERSLATIVQATPATWRMLLGSGWSGDGRLKLLCGGESLSRELADKLLIRCGALWNLYGPTETTIWSTISRVQRGKGSISIGHPIGNTQLYVLGQNLDPVPIGVAGELYIGGMGLARGYLNRPDLTAERFIPHPFGRRVGDRLYRTGDLARHLPNGEIEFLGRIDNQVKVHGYRIEPGEIEAVLSKNEFVQEAAVTIGQDQRSEKRLIAYVALTTNLDTRPVISSLRAYLVDRLPLYMIPAAFVVVNTLPRTPNGKLDLKALPPVNFLDGAGSKPFAPPRDKLEKRLTEIWETLLEARPISVTANFFDIGGHSLLTPRLLAEVEMQFRVRMPLLSFFKNPTIEGMANDIRTTPKHGKARSWISNLVSRFKNQPAIFGRLPRQLEEYYHSARCLVMDRDSPLVAFRSRNSNRPFFCIPGALGTAFYLYHLSRCLGSDQPFYGLQALGMQPSDPTQLVQNMASHYIRAIQTVQKRGPYLLGGHSFGGLVAFEMAQQLSERGEEVALLAIIDAFAPSLEGDRSRTHLDDMMVLTFLVDIVENWTGKPLAPSIKSLEGIDNKERFDTTIKRLARLVAPRIATPMAASQIRLLFGVLKASMNARYVPERLYSGKITLIRAEEDFHEAMKTRGDSSVLNDPALGWNRYTAKSTIVHVISGNHVTLMNEPQVVELADRLRHCIEQTSGSDRSWRES